MKKFNTAIIFALLSLSSLGHASDPAYSCKSSNGDYSYQEVRIYFTQLGPNYMAFKVGHIDLSVDGIFYPEGSWLMRRHMDDTNHIVFRSERATFVIDQTSPKKGVGYFSKSNDYSANRKFDCDIELPIQGSLGLQTKHKKNEAPNEPRN